MKRRLAVAVITILVATSAAGCGDSGDAEDGRAPATTTTATTPTAAPAAGGPPAKTQFVRDADEICTSTFAGLKSAGAKIRASIAKSKKPPPEKQLVAFVTDQSLPAYDRMLDRLRELSPPQRDVKAFDAYIASLAGAIDGVKAAPSAYVRQTSNDPFAVPNARARKLGLKACGS